MQKGMDETRISNRALELRLSIAVDWPCRDETRISNRALELRLSTAVVLNLGLESFLGYAKISVSFLDRTKRNIGTA
jgi:hypothetical protein